MTDPHWVQCTTHYTLSDEEQMPHGAHFVRAQSPYEQSHKQCTIVDRILYYIILPRQAAYIDSLDGLTFRNQLMSIMLVMPTGQHLHAMGGT